MTDTRGMISYTLIAITILGVMADTSASVDDGDREIMLTNFPYGRVMDNEMQLAKVLLVPQRPCHSKRNSELINSLLGLPKNMNNAGRK